MVHVIRVKRRTKFHNLSGTASKPFPVKNASWAGLSFWSTANNYELMLSWLGISTGIENCSSILEKCYQQPTLFPVMDGGRHIFDYDQLRDTFSSPDRHTPWRKAKAGSL